MNRSLNNAICIMGIDPGLQRTGWGVIRVDHHHVLAYLGHGVITTKTTLTLPQRLAHIAQEMNCALDRFQPHEVAVEEIFVNQNPLSTLKLGMARGIGLMVPASKGIPVFEYGANRVKKMVVGVGHADKSQVTQMVQYLLPKAPFVDKDAADALAVALCHAYTRSTFSKIEAAL